MFVPVFSRPFLLLSCGGTFHLNEPFRTAHLGKDDDVRLGWEAACHVPADDSVVRRITQIDDEIVDVRHAHSAVLEQGLDIVEQPDSLFLHVAEIEDIAISVDACRSGDECNLLVGKVRRVPRSKATPYSWVGLRWSSAWRYFLSSSRMSG